MTTNTKNLVPATVLVAIAEKMGATVLAQSGYYKITGKRDGWRIYVAKQDLVGRIDVSGFTHPLAVACSHKQAGSVSGEIQVGLDPKTTIMHFTKILKDALVDANTAVCKDYSAKTRKAVSEPVDVDAYLKNLGIGVEETEEKPENVEPEQVEEMAQAADQQ